MVNEGVARRGARVIAWGLAANLIVLFFQHWTLLQLVTANAPGIAKGLVLAFYSILATAIVGLLGSRPWGFWCANLLVPTGTFLLGIALVPYVTTLLPTAGARTVATAVLSLAFLGATIVAHRMYARSNSKANQPPLLGTA